MLIKKVDFKKLIVDNGGFTIDPNNGDNVTSGYAVSLRGFELTIDINEFTNFHVLSYLKTFKEVFNNYPEASLGAWFNVDNNKIYLDISLIYVDNETARKVAINNEQIAYFHLDTFTEIRV